MSVTRACRTPWYEAGHARWQSVCNLLEMDASLTPSCCREF